MNALPIIDSALEDTTKRSLFSSDEVRDLLLDLRQAVSAESAEPTPALAI